MKILRYAAAAVTILMSLLNLPFAFADGVSPPIGWLVTLLGVAGIVAAVALLSKANWASWAVTAVGMANLAGAIVALVMNRDGAVVGLVLSTLIIALGLTCVRAPARGPRPA
jgi:hypothetical protein